MTNDLTIELARPLAGAEAHHPRAQHKEGDHLDRGERIILVNGERWGRTRVKWHGCRGASYHFEQEAGHMICHDPKEKNYWKEYKWLSIDGASSNNRGHTPREIYLGPGQGYGLNPKWKSTDDLVVAKVRELIGEGRLRHPTKIKEETAADLKRWQNEQRVQAEAEATAFKTKAMDALRVNDPDGEMVARVVDAMRWAQKQ